jgi:hypothetical protein
MRTSEIWTEHLLQDSSATWLARTEVGDGVGVALVSVNEREVPLQRRTVKEIVR